MMKIIILTCFALKCYTFPTISGIEPIESSCNHICSGQTDDPICGTDGQTYPNKCVFDLSRCLTGTRHLIEIDHMGPCCPGEICYGPVWSVCGSDGKIYDNECMMRQESCRKNMIITKYHNGICDSSEHQTTCPKFCNGIENPVCGSNGVTYTNECLLKLNTCENDIFVTKEHDGRCNSEGKTSKNIGEIAKPCPLFCNGMEMEVCGSDGVNYKNECILLKKSCMQNLGIKKVHDGPCK